MAELSMTPVAPVNPAIQSPSANNGGMQASGADATTQQSSFAHVLKERSDANGAEKKSASADTPKTDKTDAQAAPDKTVGAKTTDETETTSDDVARLLAAMTMGGTADDATAAAGGTDADSQALAATIAGIGDKKSDKDKAAIDPATQSNASADALALIANPAVIPVKIAPDTATNAGKADQKDLKTGLDLSSKATAKPAFALTTKANPHDKSAPPEDIKVLSTVGNTSDASAKAADASGQTTDLAAIPDAAANNRTNHALSTLTNASPAQREASAIDQAVHTPVGTRGWVEEVGQKLMWTANSDNGRAALVLTPPHMGRVEVSINVSGDQASASFIAASPAAREALQDAMPRLRELMAQAGINLGQTDVSAGQSGQPQADSRSAHGAGGRLSTPGIAGVDSSVATGRSAWIQQGRGMIDTFA